MADEAIDEVEAHNYVLLLKECREELSKAAGPNRKFYLTIACPAGPEKEKLKLEEMTPYLDFYNLMAYDFTGPWSAFAGHQANLFASASMPSATPWNTKDVVEYYRSAKVPANRIILGMPLYGRDFANTNGPGRPFSGSGPGSWQPGIWDYKALPRPDATEKYDKEAGATYSIDEKAKMMVSYDTPDMVMKKTDFITQNQLGGAMWWESSGDKGGKTASKEEGSLIGTYFEEIKKLDHTANNLNYPESKYDNLVNGFKPVS
ncbi:endochitinase 1 [Uncinocarpus reesii 1704]|uniref:chitinase n=1 Tax=Uncinocarpus reesii (strain UAMH 1704) TaxID=336963 RepID=C4JKX0_UNCRE|nr:endochitinase 1 [Uncinocarpus reesii 1704]EEP75357.1 endochitinase 1 [Uncinocarpus reesii 1704]